MWGVFSPQPWKDKLLDGAENRRARVHDSEGGTESVDTPVEAQWGSVTELAQV